MRIWIGFIAVVVPGMRAHLVENHWHCLRIYRRIFSKNRPRMHCDGLPVCWFAKVKKERIPTKRIKTLTFPALIDRLIQVRPWPTIRRHKWLPMTNKSISETPIDISNESCFISDPMEYNNTTPNSHKKKGFFKSFWKKTKHYSIEQWDSIDEEPETGLKSNQKTIQNKKMAQWECLHWFELGLFSLSNWTHKFNLMRKMDGKSFHVKNTHKHNI